MPQHTDAEPRQQLRSIAIVVALGLVGALVGVILWGGVGAAVGAVIGLAIAAVRWFRDGGGGRATTPRPDDGG